MARPSIGPRRALVGYLGLACAFLLLVSITAANGRSMKEPDAETFMDQGDRYLAKKQYDKAMEAFTEAIHLDPKNASAYFNRGYAHAQKKEYDKAIKDYTRAIRFDPQEIDSYINRGAAYEKNKQYDKAITDYTKAIRLDPRDNDAYFNRGVAYEKKEEYGKAIKDYTKAIQLNPKDTYAFSNRGNAHKMRLEYRKAIKDYTKAIQLGPNPFAHNALGWMLATCPKDGLRNGKRAIDHATKACEIWKWKDAYGLESLAAAYAEAGHFKEAVKWQRKAIQFGFPDKDKQTRAQQRLKQYEADKPHRDQ
jgi:tetratricopeptide (TPR) repeat protein